MVINSQLRLWHFLSGWGLEPSIRHGFKPTCLFRPSFVLNLGKDSNNLCLHFNPRFNAHGDANTIVCNSKENGTWGTEQREPAFPFQPGSITEVGGARPGQGPGWAGQHGQRPPRWLAVLAV